MLSTYVSSSNASVVSENSSLNGSTCFWKEVLRIKRLGCNPHISLWWTETLLCFFLQDHHTREVVVHPCLLLSIWFVEMLLISPMIQRGWILFHNIMSNSSCWIGGPTSKQSFSDHASLLARAEQSYMIQSLDDYADSLITGWWGIYCTTSPIGDLGTGSIIPAFDCSFIIWWCSSRLPIFSEMVFHKSRLLSAWFGHWNAGKNWLHCFFHLWCQVDLKNTFVRIYLYQIKQRIAMQQTYQKHLVYQLECSQVYWIQ